MTKVYRSDGIRCDKIRIDGNGILRAKAKIARVGVQDYYENGKLVREFRSPEEVQDSATSFAAQPVTLNHPVEMVDSNNANKYNKGLSGDVVDYQDGWLTTNITVTHQDAVAAAMSTHKQFSNGYWAELVDEAGVWIDELGVQGEIGVSYNYDRKQKNIVGNHIALVSTARAGKSATFTDSAEFTIDVESKTIETPNKRMVQIIHNNSVLTIEGDDASKVDDIVKELKAKVDLSDSELLTSQGKVANVESSLAQLKTDKAALEAKVDALESAPAPKLDADVIEAQVTERQELWLQVIPHMDADFTPDYKLDSLGIKKVWLSKELPNLATKIDAADDAYITPLWDLKQPEDVVTEKKTDSAKEAIKQSGSAPKLDSISQAHADYIAARTRK